MKQDKLQPGDLAIIINSPRGKSIGKIVTCLSFAGVDPKYGNVWYVESSSPIQTIGGDVLTKAHMPEKWLKRIPNEPLEIEETELELENK